MTANLPRHRLAIAAAFLVQGLLFISLTTRLPVLSQALDLSELSLAGLMPMMVLLAGVGSVGAERIARTASSARGLRAGLILLAVGTVVMRRLTGMNPIGVQGWTALIAVGPLLLWSLAVEQGQWEAIRGASALAWFGVAWATIAASLLGHSLFYWLVQRHPVSTLMPYLLVSPVIAVALGIAFWGDRPGPRLYLGAAMVLGGVLFISLRARVRARKLPEPTDI